MDRSREKFSKLDPESLAKVIKYYGASTDTPGGEKKEHAEMAQLAAKKSAEASVNVDETVAKFATAKCYSLPESGLSGSKRSRARSIHREQLDSETCRQGEQIAAKVLSTGENGSWILGNILDYDAGEGTYEVQDEDDVNRVLVLSTLDVKRLEDSASHLRRGDSVLAVFPETTSFYRAVVAKNPRPPQHGNSGWDLVVRFEDDEDDTGKAPPRRVPGRFVLKRTDVGDESD